MLSLSLGTLRRRWASLAAAGVAVGLGVAMVAMMLLTLAGSVPAPGHGAGQPAGRFAAAPVVVRATPTVGLPTSDRRRPLARPPGLSRDLLAALAALGPVTADRSFPVAAPGDRELVGHAWSAAAFTPRHLLAGRPPAVDVEVVADPPARPGDRLRLLTQAGARTYTVSGVLAPGPERTLFFTDTEAAELSPRVDAAVSHADPAAVAAAARRAGADVEVLTGTRRALATPDAQQRRTEEAVSNLRTVLGIATGVCGFVAIVVVASTFAYVVEERRREFALLRALGAAPRQIRRTVRVEALLVGIPAAAAGCLLGRAATGRLVDLIVARGLAPEGFTATGSPVLTGLAFAGGLTVSLLGVAAAARRAGRALPGAALRAPEAVSGGGDVARAVTGTVLLVGGLAAMARVSLAEPTTALKDKDYTLLVLILIGAAAVLAPLVLGRLTDVLTRPLGLTRGAVGVLVRENSRTGSRRLAATATPVLLTMGLAACLLGGSATAQQVAPAAARHRLAADYVVEPTGLPVLNRDVLARLADVPGVRVAATASTTLYASRDGEVLDGHDATAVDPAAVDTVYRLRAAEGDVHDLSDRTVVVDEEWGLEPGESVDLRLADGTPRSLTVAAVLPAGSGAFVTPALAPGAMPDRMLVTRLPGADAAAVEATLAAAVSGFGAQADPTARWASAPVGAGREYRWWGMVVVLGIALVFSGIALANTLASTTLGRRAEFGLLRLAGAGHAQVLAICAGEALLSVLVGTALAAVVSVLCLVGRWSALVQPAGSLSISVPWTALGGLLVVCVLTAVLAAVVPGWLMLRSGRAGARTGGAP